jgi:hypothetical protein
MNQQEATQYAIDGIGVLKGADIDFGQDIKAPCSICDKMVDLSSPVTVNIVDADGSESPTEMTEADARVLIVSVGLPVPPVVCSQHEEITPEFP